MILANCRSFRLVHRALNSALRLLNDLISPREERGWHIEPEDPRGLQVDHQLVAGRRLYREVGGPGSDMPQQHALASWRASSYATRQDALFLLFHHRFSSRHYVVFGFVDAVFR
jgi:hypothetical protein